MQSFKQWRMLNESLFPLGLSKTPNVAPIQSQFQFDEKKKNMDKNPEMDDDEDYDDEEDDDTDDEEGDDDSDKGEDKGDDKAPKKSCGDDGDSFPAFMKKKGMKKKMKNECDCDGKKPLESDDSDDDDDDDDMDDDRNSEDKGGDDGEDEEMGGSGGDMKRPLGFMKKKGMKNKMKKKMKKEATNPQNDFLQSFNSYTAPGNQMASDDAWWSSVNSHFSNPNKKFNDGFTEYMEDYLIDPEAQKNFAHGNTQQHGPKPGEVGYAPEGRVGQGDFFGS